MKCCNCKRIPCECETEIQLPMKSTLSPSVTEFPVPSRRIKQHRSQVPNASVRIEDVPLPFAFKLSANSVNVEKCRPMQDKLVELRSRAKLTPEVNKVTSQQSTKLPSFQDYICVIRDNSCETCSGTANSNTEPTNCQQVVRRKYICDVLETIHKTK